LAEKGEGGQASAHVLGAAILVVVTLLWVLLLTGHLHTLGTTMGLTPWHG
jgi:hypothetical protein